MELICCFREKTIGRGSYRQQDCLRSAARQREAARDPFEQFDQGAFGEGSEETDAPRSQGRCLLWPPHRRHAGEGLARQGRPKQLTLLAQEPGRLNSFLSACHSLSLYED